MGRRVFKILLAFIFILIILFVLAVTETKAANVKSIVITMNEDKVSKVVIDGIEQKKQSGYISINKKAIYLKNANSAQNVLQEALKLGNEGKKPIKVEVKAKSGKNATIALYKQQEQYKNEFNQNKKRDIYLLIYSNTELIIDNNIIIKVMEHVDKKASMITTPKVAEQRPEYTGWKNISISGGTWDANGYGDAVFKFRHGNNLTLSNLIAIHSKAHTINVSASRDILISGVKIKNSFTEEFTASRNDLDDDSFKIFSHREVLHLDYAGAGEDIFQDGTPVKNVRIENCIFKNVPCAIGNHTMASEVERKDKNGNIIATSLKETSFGDNIQILNCTFKNIEYYALNLSNLRNVTVSGCKFKTTNGKMGKAVVCYYSNAIKNSSKGQIDLTGYQNAFEEDSFVTTVLDNAEIIVPNMKYTGSEVKPIPTVKIGNTVLKYGKDFIIKEYKNNIKKGVATIKIKGIQKYRGNKTQTFLIVKK